VRRRGVPILFLPTRQRECKRERNVSVREGWRERRRKRKEGSRRGGCFPLAQIRERDSEERERELELERERQRQRAAVWKKRREEKMGFWKAPPSRHQ